MEGVKLLLIIISAISYVNGAKDDDDVGRPYEFGFTIDGQQHRHEKKDANGIIQGEFGFITADGVYHVTVYATDENGSFRILSMKNIKISPPLDGSGDVLPSQKQSLPGNPSISAPAKLQNPPSTPAPAKLQNPPSTTIQAIPTTTPKGPYRFTTQSTIKPGCASCGYVTPPPKFAFQNPAAQTNPNPQVPSLQSNNRIPDQPQPSIGQVPLLSSNQPSPNPQPPIVENVPSFQSNQQSPNPQLPGDQFNNPQVSLFPSNQPSPQPPTDLFNNPQISLFPSNQPSPQPPNNQVANPQAPLFQSDQPLQPPFSEPNPQPPFGQPNPQSPFIQPPFNQPNPQPPGFDSNQNTLGPEYPGTAEKYQSQAPPALNNNDIISQPIFPTPNQAPISRVDAIKVSDGFINVPNNPPIPIQDKYPGMVDGLPDGITEGDITDLLYKFNYTVGFHGHYEKGWRNGTKIGGYFVNGRDGFSRVVTYVADEFGYRPKFKLINLGLDSPDTPKEDTEKTFGLKSFEFVWYPLK